MKQGWKTVKLPELAKSIFAGGDVDKNNLSEVKTEEYPYPIYTNGETNDGLYGYTNIFRVNEPAITVSARGTIGFTCLRKEPYYPAVRLINIIPKENVNINYLNYFIKSKTVTSSGTSIPQLTVPMVKEFVIGIPESLEEQQTIVAKLDQAFSAIDQAKANIEKNILNAKELFQSKLNQIFSQKGEGWVERTLQDLCEKITDGSHNPPKGVEKSSYLMLSSKNIFDDSINFSNPRYLTKEDFISENKRTDVKENDVLLTIVGTIGRVAVVPKLDNYFVLQRSVAVLKPIPTEINSRFLKYTLRNAIVYLQENSRGVAQKGIYLNQLKQINLFIPNLLLQQQIVTQLDHLQEQTNVLVTKYQQKLANLEELKKSILEKAFKGELTTQKIEV